MAVDNFDSRQKLPRVAIAAAAVAIFVGVLTLAAAFVHPSYLLGGLLPIAAVITILRRRAWGGYGFALIAAIQVLLIPLLLVDRFSDTAAQAWLAMIFGAAFAVLFFLAGRALSRVGAKAGVRWPWIGLALALSVPLLFVRAYAMPSGSMENTLLIGDHLLVRVFPAPNSPTRGFDRISLSGGSKTDLS